ncbi:endonuclease/exonuclease/phosphatase family protein [SAR202 cluster bacterium AC-409-J13_OGT_754m]|nr:endonuclease/exonuclease/phosphatase family protein [SAR202 cluster bacterium AC-409-J13_OGT_754m]
MKRFISLNTTAKKLLFCLVLLVSLIGISFFAWIYLSTLQVEEVESATFVNLTNAPMLESGQNLKVLSWNIQFLAGNKNNNFFFDGGEDSWPSISRRQQVLEQIAEIIIAENPDVVLLQEVDEGAKRTGHADQLAALLNLLPKEYRNHSSAFYWKADFVPHPSVMGSVGMKLSTISKYQITEATRYALTSIQSQSWIMQQMNPKRAILEIQLPITNSGTLNVMNTHLSAFAQSDNTMEIQVKQVMGLITKKQAQGHDNIIIGGDFNLLSSSFAYNLLDTKGKSYYNPSGTELSPILEVLGSIPSIELINGKDYADWFTHSPNHISGASPDRTIDYLFYTNALTLVGQKVRSNDTLLISDHLPVIGIFRIP